MKSTTLILWVLISLFALTSTPNYAQEKEKKQQQVNAQEFREISVSIDIDKSLIPKNAEQWTLYIYATKIGERLPLALAKTKLNKLPMTTIINESMYLLPHLTLKQTEEVVIVAKATKSDNPHQKSADDIIGYSAKVSFASGNKQKAVVTINKRDAYKKGT